MGRLIDEYPAWERFTVARAGLEAKGSGPSNNKVLVFY